MKTPKKHTFTVQKDGDLSVWWIPQVPMKSFRVPVSSLQEAALIFDTLAAYDNFQYRNRIKCDYTHVGGVAVWEDGGWTDWYDEDGSTLNQWREENDVKILVEFNQ